MRHLAYTSYLLKHKARVFLNSVILGVPIRGLLHDLSKLHAVEWKGIGRQFFPSTAEEKAGNMDLFRQAKEHHRKRNSHEIDHWYRDGGTCDPIPCRVLREVMADWAAFHGTCFTRRRIRANARRCYESWGRNYKMHPDTRTWIEGFVGFIPAGAGTSEPINAADKQ